MTNGKAIAFDKFEFAGDVSRIGCSYLAECWEVPCGNPAVKAVCVDMHTIGFERVDGFASWAFACELHDWDLFDIREPDNAAYYENESLEQVSMEV